MAIISWASEELAGSRYELFSMENMTETQSIWTDVSVPH
jgi:hypothetical protein